METTVKLYNMESDAKDIADRIYNLATKMEGAGLPPNALMPAMIAVCAVGVALGATGDTLLLRTAAGA